MEYVAAPGPRPGVPLQVTENVSLSRTRTLPWGSFLSFTDQKGTSPLCLFLPREGADLVQEERNASTRVGSTARAGDSPKCVGGVPSQVVPGTEDWLPRVSGQPTWATGLEGEYQTDPEPSEQQRLQVNVGLWGSVGTESPQSHWQHLSPWLPTDFQGAS